MKLLRVRSTFQKALMEHCCKISILAVQRFGMTIEDVSVSEGGFSICLECGKYRVFFDYCCVMMRLNKRLSLAILHGDVDLRESLKVSQDALEASASEYLKTLASAVVKELPRNVVIQPPVSGSMSEAGDPILGPHVVRLFGRAPVPFVLDILAVSTLEDATTGIRLP